MRRAVNSNTRPVLPAPRLPQNIYRAVQPAPKPNENVETTNFDIHLDIPFDSKTNRFDLTKEIVEKVGKNRTLRKAVVQVINRANIRLAKNKAANELQPVDDFTCILYLGVVVLFILIMFIAGFTNRIEVILTAAIMGLITLAIIVAYLRFYLLARHHYSFVQREADLTRHIKSFDSVWASLSTTVVVGYKGAYIRIFYDEIVKDKIRIKGRPVNPYNYLRLARIKDKVT